MHNYAHAVFKLPRPPHIEVMRQALLEVGQLLQLKETFDEHLGRKDHLHRSDRLETVCIRALHAKLETMTEPEVGMMPGLDIIAGMELDEAIRAVHSLLRVRTFGRKHLIHPAVREHKQWRVAA